MNILVYLFFLVQVSAGKNKKLKNEILDESEQSDYFETFQDGDLETFQDGDPLSELKEEKEWFLYLQNLKFNFLLIFINIYNIYNFYYIILNIKKTLKR